MVHVLPIYYYRKPKRASEISAADAEVSLHLPMVSHYQVMNTEHFHVHTSNIQPHPCTPVVRIHGHVRSSYSINTEGVPCVLFFLSSLLIPTPPFSAWEVLVCRQETHEGHPKAGTYVPRYEQPCELLLHVPALSAHVTHVTPVILLVIPICHCTYLSSHQCCP